MGWLELRLVVDRTRIDSVSEVLFEQGASGVQEDFLAGEAPPVRQPWDRGPSAPLPPRALLKSWWDPVDRKRLESVCDALVREGEVLTAAQWSMVRDEDWAEAWRAGFERLVISRRLVVAPPWEARPGDLEIEPGMAFGTGEHPTTRACLEAIERYAKSGATLLDIGCGTGVLALAGALLGMDVEGIDTDGDAIRASRKNAAQNGLHAKFDTTPIGEIGKSYSLVVANLYAEVLVELSRDIIATVGQSLVLAGILTERANLVRDAFSALELVSCREEGDWTCLEYRR